ncbi:hypothetical protein BVE49_15370 [Salmonella enterica]|nr:hypothetical protein [Salmonella enterica]
MTPLPAKLSCIMGSSLCLFIGIAKTPRYEALWICDKTAALRRRLLFLLSGFRYIHAGRRNTGIRYTNQPSDP